MKYICVVPKITALGSPAPSSFAPVVPALACHHTSDKEICGEAGFLVHSSLVLVTERGIPKPGNSLDQSVLPICNWPCRSKKESICNSMIMLVPLVSAGLLLVLSDGDIVASCCSYVLPKSLCSALKCNQRIVTC